MLSHSQSSDALAGLISLSSPRSSRANSPSPGTSGNSNDSVAFEFPGSGNCNSSSFNTSPGSKFSLKANQRPRAYTEGDAYEIFEAFRRPRSNTLSDQDAVGALLSFSSEKGGGSPRSEDRSNNVTALQRERGSTASYVPRARAMSDMSHAMLRMGKMDVDSNNSKSSNNDNNNNNNSQSSNNSSGRSSSSSSSGGTNQFPAYSRLGNENIGIYSPAARRERLRRFLAKRKKRIWQKRVKYDVRKNFADSRLRFKGRFVKKEDEELMRAAMEIC